MRPLPQVLAVASLLFGVPSAGAATCDCSHWPWPDRCADTCGKAVVARYQEAVGGRARLRGVESLVLRGEQESPAAGVALPVTVYYQRPGKLRIDAAPQGMPITQAYDGKVAWMSPDPLSHGVRLLDPESAAILDAVADVTGALIDFTRSAQEVKVVDKAVAEGRDTFVVEVVRQGGARGRYYLDADTFRPVRADLPISAGGGQASYHQIAFEDYRTTGGLTLPHRIEWTLPSGQGAVQKEVLRIDRYEVDPSLDPGFFQPPDPPEPPH